MLPAIRSIRVALRDVTPSFHPSEYQFSKVSGLQLPFDFVRKLFTYERVARLSFPYPSSKLITPHTARPAPIATTSVCKIEIAELKNAICYLETGFLSGLPAETKKEPPSFHSRSNLPGIRFPYPFFFILLFHL